MAVRRKSTQQFLKLLAFVPEDFGDCVYWPFAVDNHGYGLARHAGGGRVERAHRMALRDRLGPPPSGKPFAIHSCGNGHKGCVNPWHVRWGSPADNVADRTAHGRHKPFLGEDHPAAKVTGRDVLEIRHLRSRGAGLRPLAERFGISEPTVSEICRRKIWRHV